MMKNENMDEGLEILLKREYHFESLAVFLLVIIILMFGTIWIARRLIL